MLTSWGQTPFGRGQTPFRRGQTPGFRRGQALMELAVGMFAIALVVGCLCVFAIFIAKSLRVQNSLRSSSPQPSGEKVEFGEFLYGILGRHWLVVSEDVKLPPTVIVK